jgi:hypothetical protein
MKRIGKDKADTQSWHGSCMYNSCEVNHSIMEVK